MVGEIRDLETADIAIKAAQTGHLVLSTLHTNDAPTTLTRLLNMGVAPFNIASSVILITAQRLGRKLCTHCKQPEDIPPEALLQAGFAEEDLDGSWQPYGPVGCDHCKGSGYKGRVGIYQVMPITDEMRQLIMRNGNAIDIADQAQREGVRDLRQSGLLKVKAGHHVARGSRGRHQRIATRKASDGNSTWPPQRPPPRAGKPAQGSNATHRVKEYTFVWEGTDRNNRQVRGETKAASETVVATNLRRQGIQITKIKRQTFRGGKQVTEKDITFFTRQLATMLKSGVPLLQSFDIVGPRPRQRRASRG